MPANLPPQYTKLEQECSLEKDPKKRLALLERMLAEIPKHKGTSHMVGELKHKISKMKSQLEAGLKHGASRQTSLDHIPREGAGQFALVGPPNSGKSSIVGAVTRATVEIAEWPFATRKPVPGMAAWENVHLQLIDLPPIAEEHCEPYVFNIIRTADVALLVISLGDDDLLGEYDYVLNRLHQAKIRLHGLVDPDPQIPTAVEKTTVLAVTGIDLPDAATRLMLLQDVVGDRIPIWPVSSPQQRGLKELLGACFASLGLMRAYTKTPGHPADMDDPVLLTHGATVADAARSIHKEFAEKLQFAKIWGKHIFDGQRVMADHVVEDGDILEFHM
jgi:ribosome-interacting GTPase 1